VSSSTGRARFPVAAFLALLIGFSLIIANIVAMNMRFDGPTKDFGVAELAETTGKSYFELGELTGRAFTGAAAPAAGSRATAELELSAASEEAFSKASASSLTHVLP